MLLRRARSRDGMSHLFLWGEAGVIELFCAKPDGVEPPVVGVERMLRIFILQRSHIQWNHLAECGACEILHVS